MQAVAFTFPAFGLITCLCIAVWPHKMANRVARVQEMWRHMLPVERVGLVFMAIPIPGPFDECVGFMFLGIGRIQRLVRGRRELRRFQRQVAEDTCSQHDVFCCPQCFDMSPV